MASRKHLQEIYGEDVDDPEVSEITDSEMSIALNQIITELKEKYGENWFKHIEEDSD